MLSISKLSSIGGRNSNICYFCFWQYLQYLVGYKIVNRHLFWIFGYFITALISLIVKEIYLIKISKVVSSENNLFFSFSVISRRLGLKSLERCVTNVWVFFFTSGPAPVLLSDRRILSAVISVSWWLFIEGMILVSEVALNLLGYSCIPWFLFKSNRFLSALIARFNLFFKIEHLLVCHSLRSFFFSTSFSFIADEYSILISVLLLIGVVQACYTA